MQQAHHKSSDIAKIRAAVDVYRGLAPISSIRPEVVKKLRAMLKTNPYPAVRVSVAECLWLTTGEEDLLRLRL